MNNVQSILAVSSQIGLPWPWSRPSLLKVLLNATSFRLVILAISFASPLAFFWAILKAAVRPSDVVRSGFSNAWRINASLNQLRSFITSSFSCLVYSVRYSWSTKGGLDFTSSFNAICKSCIETSCGVFYASTSAVPGGQLSNIFMLGFVEGRSFVSAVATGEELAVRLQFLF